MISTEMSTGSSLQRRGHTDLGADRGNRSAKLLLGLVLLLTCLSQSFAQQLPANCSRYSLLVSEFSTTTAQFDHLDVFTIGSAGPTLQCSIGNEYAGEGIAVNPVTNRAYIATLNPTPRISVWDYVAGKEIASIDVSSLTSYLFDIALSPDGAYVYVSGSDNLLKISTATNAIVATRPTTDINNSTSVPVWGIAVNPVSGDVYITSVYQPDNGNPSTITYQSPTLTGTISTLVTAPSGYYYRGIVFDAVGNLWAVASSSSGASADQLIKYNGTTGAVLGNYFFPTPTITAPGISPGSVFAMDIAWGPGGNLYVSTFDGDCVTKFDITTNTFSTYIPYVNSQAGAKNLAFMCGDFTCDPPIRLGDYVWLDTNQNGQQDATETGVASVTAVLYNATTNQPISTTLTDANGNYLFNNLDPGSYYVKFTAPSGMTFTSANVGNDATDSDAGVGGQTGVYSLTAGQQDLTVDAGLVPVSTPCVPASYTLCGAKTSFTLTAGSMYTNVQWYKDGVAIPGATSIDYVATTAGLYSYTATDASGCSTSLCCPISLTNCAKAALGDYVWYDNNKNGQQDPGEPPAVGVTVTLYNATTNQPISTTVTDGTGHYLFPNLDPGTYYVVFTAPSGATFTTPNSGNDTTDSDAGVGGKTGNYTLVAGQVDLTVDAGLIPQCTSPNCTTNITVK